MYNVLENLSLMLGPVAFFIVAFIAIVSVILTFCMPFFIYKIRNQAILQTKLLEKIVNNTARKEATL